MDPTVLAYSASLFAAVLAISTISILGTWELHAQSVPPYLADQGYTTEIFVNQITDEVDRIQAETATQIDINMLIAGRITPIGELESYFGLADVVRASQSVLGLAPPRIEVEIVQRGDSAHWLVRGPHVIRGETVVQGVVKLEETDLLFERIAHNSISFISPFRAIGFDLVQDFRTKSYEQTIEKTSNLLIECEGVRSVACSDENRQLGLIIRAVAHMNMRSYDRALRDLRVANRTGKESAVATAFIGDTFTKMSEPDQATKSYARAAQLDPRIAEIFTKFGLGLLAAGDAPLAAERFDTAAALGATGPVFLAKWGGALAAAENYRGALEKYLEAKAAEGPSAVDIYGERIAKMRAALSGKDSKPSPAPQAAPQAAPQTAPDAAPAPATPKVVN